MSRFPQPITHLIHEHLSVLMTFAFSRGPLEAMLAAKFIGQWKYLERALLTISEQRAERAALELALFLRLLDDDENLSGFIKEHGFGAGPDCGRLTRAGRADEPLSFRDVTNKIIHAARLEWDFSSIEDPKLICIGRERERWLKAEVRLNTLAAFCGGLTA